MGGPVGSLRAEVIPGGRSNLTYIVDDGVRRFVVRRPPLAHVLPTAHDMAREYRVLAALQDTGIPVPHVIALCEDESVIGAPFYVMEWIDGHVVRDALPAGFPDTRETRQAMSSALVSTLLHLHAIDPDAIGLAGFGHPEGFLGRQVRRWWQQWEASKTRELPCIEELHRRLDETVPVQSAPGIVHGDYRLDNVMYAPTDPGRIVAVIDWEMCTIGDPLCDVGLLCVYWSDDETEAAGRALHGMPVTVQDGFYKRADILRDYAAGTQRDMSALEWYIALGAYKLAIIAEGITARFLMGMTVGEGFERMGEMVPAIVEGGLDALDRLGSSGGG
ncbi:MAG TPA: phosphotransferase family protein [Candidatus Acidoferrales bacterium]|nr:phosphotransferase family protein [Candidatus Acidoferrales bacterium]